MSMATMGEIYHIHWHGRDLPHKSNYLMHIKNLAVVMQLKKVARKNLEKFRLKFSFTVHIH